MVTVAIVGSAVWQPGADSSTSGGHDPDMFGKTGQAPVKGTREVTGEVTGEVSRLLTALGEKSLGRTELQLALGLKGQANVLEGS